MKVTKDTFKWLIALLFPVFIAWLIWGHILNPETYWQKLASIIGAFITGLIIMRIEIEVIS